MKTIRVGIVGAGAISDQHIGALKQLEKIKIVVVVDLDRKRAEALAAKAGGAEVLTSIDDICNGRFEIDAAHVLLPPQMHFDAALRLLQAGVHVLVEKPLATTSENCTRLVDAAIAANVNLSVNHNLLCDPLFVAFREHLIKRTFGPVRHVTSNWHVPLAPLTAGKHDLWMLQDPLNSLLEQAVHPLSQLVSIGGEAREVTAQPGKERRLNTGAISYDSWEVVMDFPDFTGHLHYSLGRTFRVQTLEAICDDGVIHVDFITRSIRLKKVLHYNEPFQSLFSAVGEAASSCGQAVSSFLRTFLSDLGVRRRPDVFSETMRASIKGFYESLEGSHPAIDQRHGLATVSICEQVNRFRRNNSTIPHVAKAPIAKLQSEGSVDLLVLGGTGYIGREVVNQALDKGKSVRVMVRNPKTVPQEWLARGLQVRIGDLDSIEDTDPVFANARIVIDTVWPTDRMDMENRIPRMAGRVADACISAGVERLVYLGTIGSLDMRSANTPICGDTGLDRSLGRRNAYARGKGLAEGVLLDRAQNKNLTVCILRPGIVVGCGAALLHGGLGSVKNQRHLVGIGGGRNPMPFVLVEDVADAILRATGCEIAGSKSFNLVGDVRPTTRDYLARVAAASERPFEFHSTSVAAYYSMAVSKWLIKRVTGRREAFPARAEIANRTMVRQFDCGDAKSELNWTPESDTDRFFQRVLNPNDE